MDSRKGVKKKGAAHLQVAEDMVCMQEAQKLAYVGPTVWATLVNLRSGALPGWRPLMYPEGKELPSVYWSRKGRGVDATANHYRWLAL